MSGKIQIEFAKVDDILSIQRFLHEHWRENHVFVTHPELLRWQHRDPDAPASRITFVLAWSNSEDHPRALVGLLGYIPFRRFDASADWTELALAVWKVRDDIGAPGLGLLLLKFIKSQCIPALLCAIGTSAMVRPI